MIRKQAKSLLFQRTRRLLFDTVPRAITERPTIEKWKNRVHVVERIRVGHDFATDQSVHESLFHTVFLGFHDAHRLFLKRKIKSKKVGPLMNFPYKL